jgi:ketosteroid isomerase-like protein
MADSHEVTIEVEAAYRHYVDVFNRRDPIEIADLYDRPHAQVIGEVGLSIVNDDADQQAWYEFVMSYLDDQDWDHTEIDDLQVWPFSATVAQLIATVTRYKPDGSVLNRARANYTLRRQDDGWRVILTFPLLEDDFRGPTQTVVP